jgi:hypothetical protein
MNLGRFKEALTLLKRCPNQPQKMQLAAACRKAMRETQVER